MSMVATSHSIDEKTEGQDRRGLRTGVRTLIAASTSRLFIHNSKESILVSP